MTRTAIAPTLVFLLLCALCVAPVSLQAGDRTPKTSGRKNEAGKERRKERKKNRKKRQSPISRAIATRFEKKKSDSDLLRGIITHAIPTRKDRKVIGWTARIVLNWGDLDRKIPKCGRQHYSNWDGSISISGGTGSVLAELRFDDGKGANSDAREPKVGTGRDKLDSWKDTKKVSWRAGVVGATDGLVVEIRMKTPNASGKITCGGFSIPYRITPRPNGEATEDAGVNRGGKKGRQRTPPPGRRNRTSGNRDTF